MASPQYVMGTQGFASAWTEENVHELITTLGEAGINHYDAARLYPATNPGAAEKLLGSVRRSDFVIDTKILYRPSALSNQNMEQSIHQSLESLGVKKIDTLYAHAPDKDTPIAEQAANFDHFYRAGLFAELGLCNYSPAQLSEWIELATERNYVRPTVYQGQYNMFCRHYEKELFPLLQKHQVKFVANSPLAGGFLTGKLTFAEEAAQLRGTRFEQAEGNMVGYLFRAWYDKPDFHQAIRELATWVDRGVAGSLSQAALRWLLFHSGLRSTDSVALGPSNVSQLKEYLDARNAGPLPEEVVKAIDQLYEPLQEEAAPVVEIGWWSM
ncbi:Aldo/keto reductase [Aspergillus steynii IBT 23096]|uniref:Aldo/keto reductase n=1 Tax=Aspergillus steynii IBT 23096 TaxID=1392250 RepID=A0A2I2GDA0_9EURO|nr:Aldo/keto reductase [Aspergillus steynii IBT 23096]PLB50869.1 Aldo/keto reductase [Aspergillus steynii IBT 23096]